MKLERVERAESPLGAGRTRLTGEITFHGKGVTSDRLWFDVADEFASDLSETGNPWLACLLPLAVTLREPLELALPVDPELREGAEALMRVWQGWYPGECEPVAIETDLLDAAQPDPAGRNGAFFSGGLDSFHTLLRHQPGGDAHYRLTLHDLITVWGLDIPLDNPAAFQRLETRLARVAASTGTTSLSIATNLRESSWQRTNWGKMGQAPALAAIALSLEGRFQRVLLPSSIPYTSTRPWGTHPLVDPLLSTSRMLIRNDGAAFRRAAKTKMVAQSDLAMENLRVCWMGRSDGNCGKCEKCLRTLTMFELLGLRERCVTFPADAWSLDGLAALRLRQEIDRRHMERIRLLALDCSRPDVVRAVDRSLRNYHLRRGAVAVARALGFRRSSPVVTS